MIPLMMLLLLRRLKKKVSIDTSRNESDKTVEPVVSPSDSIDRELDSEPESALGDFDPEYELDTCDSPLLRRNNSFIERQRQQPQ